MFSLVTCFVGVFAWFQNDGVRRNGANPFSINADPNILTFSVSLYKYDYDLAAGYVLEEDDPDFTFVLNKYDKFIPERNTNNNNILRFDIEFKNLLNEGTQRKVDFSYECLTSVAGTKFDNGIVDTKQRLYSDDYGYKYSCESKSYVCNKISNVIYFKLLPYTYTVDGTVYKFDDTLDIDETVPANTYEDATEAFVDIEESTFVTNNSKVTTIDNDSVTVPAKTKKMIIYLEYSYNDELVESFLNPNEFVVSPETAEIFIGGVTIEFFKDVLGLFLSSEVVGS